MRIDFNGKKANACTKIDDWTSLGAAIGVKTNTMSYALMFRDNLQKRIRLGDRIVYKSESSLRFVQGRIMPLLEELFDDLEDTSSAIAYRKGVSPVDVVKNTAHAKRLIHFDIRHYYDNITLKHLENSLMKLGFPQLGARLVGRYNCIKAHGRSTLQQGSPASPVLSNIVGHFIMDMPIKKWLNETFPEVEATFLRYCDNAVLFVHSDAPEYFSEAYKEFVKRHLKNNGFRTHKWASIADNNRFHNQYFLGMVVNAEAKKERDYVCPLLATLFNWCRFGIKNASDRFLELYGLDVDHMKMAGPTLVYKKFKQTISGKINYIANINDKQGLMLKKLYAAANYLDEQLNGERAGDSLIEAIKKYRDINESVDEYLDKIKDVCQC